MTKISAVTIAMLLYSCTATSQSKYGLKAGINLANQVKTIGARDGSSYRQNTESYLGYQVGVFYRTNLSKQFIICTELNLSTIGSSMMLTAPDWNSYDSNEKLGYIEVPVTVQYLMNKFSIGLGPSVSFLLFSKLTKFANMSFNLSNYQTFDAAANLLAGYALSRKLDVNIRYSHGLLNIYKDPGNYDTKNKFYNLSFLYSLK